MNVRRIIPAARYQLGQRVSNQKHLQWVCKSCRAEPLSRTSFSTTRCLLEKPYYVTTPIFYVNAAPHVGHLYTMVLTDILKRWQVMRGKQAILCTGTDEHGMKVQRAAAQAQTPPKEFCDLTAGTFKSLAKRAGLANDHFVRTTDPDHKEAVQYFWQMLKEREYIYESKHEGWYCVSDETYYPESTIEKRLDPYTGRTFMASQETGKEVEWTSERNYHFRLSAFKDRLLDFYKENPGFVVPAARMSDVVKWVTDGLQDLSISRPVERLTWGIQVPDDESQTIYVWLDALVNYITKAGYPWAPGKENSLGWPADVQVIGKDIVRFHCIYWPAFLIALDLQPPKQILTHAHWTLNHEKMAKSTGNVVNPFFAIDRFGVDPMRYYLAHDGGITNDSDYGNDYIVERYKKGLQGGLGNLVSRVTRPKIWSIRKAVQGAKNVGFFNLNKRTDVQIAMLETLSEKANAKMAELNPGAALHIIMNAVYDTNRYLQDQEPWALAKILQSGRKEAKLPALINCTIYHSAEAIRIVGILLQPYMPEKAAQLLDMIGVDKSRRTFDNAKLGADDTYGTAKIPVGRDAWDGLFPPLPVEK
ncbi:probable METHIONYL-TRNA SYNTHETASE, mitochondrial [Rhynchosporium agropyri]|uniref:Probable methionine--tRNA ligase, mitochondrial n=1 Tax=Rhynchosporium agropyri TaxID=914238 RepID=A0A1E1JVH0_9HELO|nr:probable METHIONYL-TRNA SYNTHETASE, mitochondrial [Rhynchosporium agropyri]